MSNLSFGVKTLDIRYALHHAYILIWYIVLCHKTGKLTISARTPMRKTVFRALNWWRYISKARAWHKPQLGLSEPEFRSVTVVTPAWSSGLRHQMGANIYLFLNIMQKTKFLQNLLRIFLQLGHVKANMVWWEKIDLSSSSFSSL